MVEDVNNNTEIELHKNDPREHVRVMKDRYPDRDLEEYFTDYSIDMAEDSINTFYGGTLAFGEDGLQYEEERSKEHVELVKDRRMLEVGQWLEDPKAANFDYKGLTKEQRDNRGLLKSLMINQGFVNYPYEWWHYSYGDKYWGYVKDKVAIYDSVEGDI